MSLVRHYGKNSNKNNDDENDHTTRCSWPTMSRTRPAMQEKKRKRMTTPPDELAKWFECYLQPAFTPRQNNSGSPTAKYECFMKLLAWKVYRWKERMFFVLPSFEGLGAKQHRNVQVPMFNISFCCCRHNVSNIFVQLTEGRSARDQPFFFLFFFPALPY